MKIQSLSIVVPNPKCVNDCKFCVSKMNENGLYKNQMDDNLPFFDLYLKDYLKRLQFARDNGCNTVMLTGNSEPQQNRKFLTYFGMFMQMMDNPFRWIEMQTTGVMLDRNYLRFLRNHVGVNTISLSVSSFLDDENNSIISTPSNHPIDLSQLCADIKEYDFSLRLSINLNSAFNRFSRNIGAFFEMCNILGADQVTLRVLYNSGSDTPQDLWINQNSCDPSLYKELMAYIKHYGKVLGALPHGAKKYSVDEMCVVIDVDCMDKAEKTEEDYKYLILRPNCKLYSQWDDPASLIF